MYENTCCLITGLFETGSHNPAGPVHNHVTWLALLERNSDGAPLLENSPQTEGMRRTLRFWWKEGVLPLRSNFGALLQTNSSRHSVSGWLQKGKEIQRILHFLRIKGILRLRRTRGKGSRFSCWVANYCQLLPTIANILLPTWDLNRLGP